MEEQENEIWLIVNKVLRNEATPAEVKIFNDWIALDTANRNYFQLLKNIEPEKKPFNDKVKLRIHRRIQAGLQPKAISRSLLVWRLTAAASVLIIVALVFLLREAKAPANMEWVQAQTPPGVRSKIILPDGSSVFLNSGSLLSYPVKFTGKDRMIKLVGEAYFEVNKDKNHPFIVFTRQINVRVFGTHFNVKAYDDENVVETTLIEGSVGVYKSLDVLFKEGIRLQPDQQAIYNIKGDNLYFKQVDSQLSAIWKDGKYYFENETLSSITRKLERSFNVRIRIASPELDKELFYGLFNNNRNIFQLLDVMKIHNDFNYKMNKDTIIIYRN